MCLSANRAVTDNLPKVVYASRLLQFPSRVRRNERVEVLHLASAVNEGVIEQILPTGLVSRLSRHHAEIIDRLAQAVWTRRQELESGELGARRYRVTVSWQVPALSLWVEIHRS